MKRLFFPLLAAIVLSLFAVSSVIAVGLSLAVPAVLLLLATGFLVALQPGLALGCTSAGVRALQDAWSYLALVAHGFWQGLRPLRPDFEGSEAHRARYPELWALVDQTCQLCGERPVDRIYLREGIEYAAEQRSRGWLRRSQRILHVGVSGCYLFTVDELQSVIAHELMHLRGFDNQVNQAVHDGYALVAAFAEAHDHPLSPVFWSSRFAMVVIETFFLGWSRQLELDADRGAALLVGSNHMQAALRRVQEELLALMVCRLEVDEGCLLIRAAPTHPIEAAYRLFLRVEPKDRKSIGRSIAGDPLDVLGSTHPTYAQRVAQLRTLPPKPARDRRRAIGRLIELRQWEAQQGRRGGTKMMAPDAFIEALRQHHLSQMRPAETYDPDRLELDWG